MVAAIERGGPTPAEFHEAISSRAGRWFSACLRITRNSALAEDAVQEALLCAWDKRAQFQGTSSLDTWIHRIAVNAALQLMRKERPNRYSSLEHEMPGNTDSPEEILSQQDVQCVLDATIRDLSEIERVCFLLKHMEQWRLSEIADELDTNVGAVKQAIFRAVKKLRLGLPDIRSVL
jgi:RNA polymerase sigma-70 factor (ECF subfamily)